MSLLCPRSPRTVLCPLPPTSSSGSKDSIVPRGRPKPGTPGSLGTLVVQRTLHRDPGPGTPEISGIPKTDPGTSGTPKTQGTPGDPWNPETQGTRRIPLQGLWGLLQGLQVPKWFQKPPTPQGLQRPQGPQGLQSRDSRAFEDTSDPRRLGPQTIKGSLESQRPLVSLGSLESTHYVSVIMQVWRYEEMLEVTYKSMVTVAGFRNDMLP